MKTTTQQPAIAPPMSATQSAQVVLALLSDYAVRNELEKFFAREWEIATGFAEFREAMDAQNLKLEEEAEDLANQREDIANAALELMDAMDAKDKDRIADARKTLKSLL